jgi:AcrR family transcriptional regulator
VPFQRPETAAPLTPEGEVRRQDVLDRAAELFALKGFHGTSITDIAASTPLKKPTLYHYFTSKQAILAEILDNGIRALLRDAAPAAAIADPAERIQALLAAHLTNFQDKLPQVMVFLLERHALEAANATSYLELRSQYDALFVDAIREGQAQGMFREDDPVILAYAVLGMVNWMAQWYDPAGRLPLSDISSIMQRLVLAALRPDGQTGTDIGTRPDRTDG